MKKSLSWLPLLAMLLIFSACNTEELPHEESGLQITQTAQSNLESFSIHLDPTYNSEIQRWTYSLRIENRSGQTLKNFSVQSPNENTHMKEMKPQEWYTSTGTWLPTDKPQFSIYLSWEVNGELHRGNAVYQITKE